MNRDPVETLLQRADRAAGPPPAGPADLADRIRRLARRRHRTQVVIRTAAAAVVAIGLGLAIRSAAVRPGVDDGQAVSQQPAPAPSPSDEEVTRLRMEIAQLRREADDLAEQIRGMAVIQQQRQRLDRLERAVARLESGEEVRAEMERAAFTIVYQADRMYRELGRRESAVEAYREAIRLFPETASAQIARTRLSEIDGQGEQL